jgi:hypothetical protein
MPPHPPFLTAASGDLYYVASFLAETVVRHWAALLLVVAGSAWLMFVQRSSSPKASPAEAMRWVTATVLALVGLMMVTSFPYLWIAHLFPPRRAGVVLAFEVLALVAVGAGGVGWSLAGSRHAIDTKALTRASAVVATIALAVVAVGAVSATFGSFGSMSVYARQKDAQVAAVRVGAAAGDQLVIVPDLGDTTTLGVLSHQHSEEGFGEFSSDETDWNNNDAGLIYLVKVRTP